MVAEVALACALLVSSALLVRTVREMMRVPLGVEADATVLTSIQLTPADGSQEAWAATGALHSRVLERLRERLSISSWHAEHAHEAIRSGLLSPMPLMPDNL